MSKPVRLLFVCLGNICRSPTAEGIMRKIVEEAGLEEQIVIDSAGTGGWHKGEAPDGRMQEAAKARGYLLDGQARQVKSADFEQFDHIYAMDHSNLSELRKRCPYEMRDKLHLFRSLDELGKNEDTPDPYYGGSRGFDEVVTIVERCCQSLLGRIQKDVQA